MTFPVRTGVEPFRASLQGKPPPDLKIIRLSFIGFDARPMDFALLNIEARGSEFRGSKNL
jgi:hypothetical protein